MGSGAPNTYSASIGVVADLAEKAAMDSRPIDEALQKYLLAVLRAHDALEDLALTEKARTQSLSGEASTANPRTEPGQQREGPG